jgi:hypothetical protein
MCSILITWGRRGSSLTKGNSYCPKGVFIGLFFICGILFEWGFETTSRADCVLWCYILLLFIGAVGTGGPAASFLLFAASDFVQFESF